MALCPCRNKTNAPFTSEVHSWYSVQADFLGDFTDHRF
jgi:hypothetical protein